MIEWLEPLTQGDAFEWRKALVSLLLAFGLGQAIAVVYMATFRGLSYSRSTVHGMAVLAGQGPLRDVPDATRRRFEESTRAFIEWGLT